MGYKNAFYWYHLVLISTGDQQIDVSSYLTPESPHADFTWEETDTGGGGGGGGSGGGGGGGVPPGVPPVAPPPAPVQGCAGCAVTIISYLPLFSLHFSLEKYSKYLHPTATCWTTTQTNK